MLNKKYFDDAFILHDDTNELKSKNEIMLHLMETESLEEVAANANEIESLNKNFLDNRKFKMDKRSRLNESWALFKNVLRFQPMWHIRNYLGEYCSLYFAWCGTLISTLWLPVLVGLAFFVAGVINRCDLIITFSFFYFDRLSI